MLRRFFLKSIRNIRIRWEKFSSLRYSVYFLVTFVLLTYILSANIIPNPFRPQLGKQSPIDKIAPTTMEVEDKLATEEARQKEEYSIPLIYTIDPTKTAASLDRIDQVFKEVKEVREENIPTSRQITILRRVMPFPISEKTFLTLLSISDDARNSTQRDSKEILKKVMEKGVKTNDIPQARIEIERRAKSLPEPGERADAITELAQEALRTNQSPDWASIDKKRAEIGEHYRLHPIMRQIEKGTPIISKGEIITKEKMDLLMHLGYISSSPNSLTIIGMAILSLLFLGILSFYLVHYHGDLLREEKQLLLFSLILLVTALVSKILIIVSGYLAPVAMASILIAILFDGRLSLIGTAILSLIVGLLTNELRDMVVAFLGGCVAIFGVTRVTNRFHLISASFLVLIANVFTIMTFSLLENDSPSQFLHHAFWGGLNGFLSVILAIGILPFLEYISGVATPFRLMELSNPNEPLLRRLLAEAPGTYHHSILVANLAENAAQAIKANSLLVRTGAYYHDIGKMRRPYFFIENQMGGENPHDKLNPSLSTLIVTAHTRDGLEMAKVHHLPKEVQEIVVQHHGTRPVNYFYHQAVTKEGAENVNRDDFRHEGPRPQSREAAILMLSDAVEAATRALAKPTPSKIEQTVRQIIREVMMDGQLDECNLSFKELNILIETYIRLLTGMYHHRIEYPDTSKLSLGSDKTGQPKGKILQFGN